MFNGCIIRSMELLQMSPSSSGLGHWPFTPVTGVRLPVGTPIISASYMQDTLRYLHVDTNADTKHVNFMIYS